MIQRFFQHILRVCRKYHLNFLFFIFRKQISIVLQNLFLPFRMHTEFRFINKYKSSFNGFTIL